MCRITFAVFACCTVVPCTLTAQEGEHAKGLCLYAAAAPSCGSYLITEAHARYRLSGAAGQSAFYLTAEAGWMKNLGNDAVGFTVFGGHDFGFETGRAGLKGRYRRWLGGAHRLDVSAGLLLSSEGSELFGVAGPGVVVGLGYSLGDWVHLTAELDYAPAERQPESSCGADSPDQPECWWGRYYEGPTTPSLYLGAALGKKAGLASYAVAGLVGLLAAAFSGMDFGMSLGM
jgi:hypothetical protein